MKKLMFAGMVLALGTVNVLADCTPATKVTNAATILSGQLIEDTGNNTGREVHCPGGNLVELAKGVGDPVDPTRIVGSWKASGPNVTYSYSGGSSYKFQLHEVSGTYYFCDISGSVKASGSLTSGSCTGAL